MTLGNIMQAVVPFCGVLDDVRDGEIDSSSPAEPARRLWRRIPCCVARETPPWLVDVRCVRFRAERRRMSGRRGRAFAALRPGPRSGRRQRTILQRDLFERAFGTECDN